MLEIFIEIDKYVSSIASFFFLFFSFFFFFFFFFNIYKIDLVPPLTILYVKKIALSENRVWTNLMQL